MKFYISSRVKQKHKTRDLKEKLESRGHSMTFDWTNYPSIKPYRENWEESGRASGKMIQAIKDCDVFVIFPDSSGGTGMYFELGVAVAENKKCFAIGDNIKKPIFMFHPNVTHVASVEELLEQLQSL